MTSIEIPLIPTTIGPYQFRATLGEGASSVVKLAFNTETHQYFACKVISMVHLSESDRLSKFETEIRIMQRLSHPYIVDLVDIMKDDNFYYIIMEFCARGELFEYIIANKKLTESEAKTMISQILEAVLFLHISGVAHRDLKPENLLLDTFCHVKITDFGLSKIVEPNHLVNTPCGSPCYASPECLSNRPYDAMKSDIWSCGVILYTMVTGQMPWNQNRNSGQLFKQIQAGDFATPQFLSDNCRDLINKIMCVDPEKRITIEEAFNHPWLKNVAKLKSCTTKAAVSTLNADDLVIAGFRKNIDKSSKDESPLKRSNSSSKMSLLVKENEKVVLPPIRSNKDVSANSNSTNSNSANSNSTNSAMTTNALNNTLGSRYQTPRKKNPVLTMTRAVPFSFLRAPGSNRRTVNRTSLH